MMKDWQKDMDKLAARTTKNWWKTGNSARPLGVTGSFSLAPRAAADDAMLEAIVTEMDVVHPVLPLTVEGK